MASALRAQLGEIRHNARSFLTDAKDRQSSLIMGSDHDLSGSCRISSATAMPPAAPLRRPRRTMSPLLLLLLAGSQASALRLYLSSASALSFNSPHRTVSSKSNVAASSSGRPGRHSTTLWQLRMAVEAPVKIPERATIINPGKPQDDSASDPGKKFKLLLFNDNVNKREYVAKVLTANIPELTQADAYVIMQKAHKSGMAVVGVWMFELAEAYCERLRAGGLISSVAEED
eukprot:6199744-Pleurochrysis_carterae.AAC.5